MCKPIVVHSSITCTLRIIHFGPEEERKSDRKAYDYRKDMRQNATACMHIVKENTRSQKICSKRRNKITETMRACRAINDWDAFAGVTGNRFLGAIAPSSRRLALLALVPGSFAKIGHSRPWYH